MKSRRHSVHIAANAIPGEYPPGFALVEILVGIGITAVLLATFATLIVQSKKISRQSRDEFLALLYLREAVEITKDLEMSDWAEFENPDCQAPSVCHPAASGNVWKTFPDEETVGGIFHRTISFSGVYRDPAGFPNEIVASGGTLDPNTKKITATIAWNNGSENRTRSLETYVYQYP